MNHQKFYFQPMHIPKYRICISHSEEPLNGSFTIVYSFQTLIEWSLDFHLFYLQNEHSTTSRFLNQRLGC